MKYYIDNSKDNATKYILKDSGCFYTGAVGFKKDNCFLKFVLTACYKINESNIKEYSLNDFKSIISNDLEKSYIKNVDYKKLYKKV